jgi:hypothetical protein
VFTISNIELASPDDDELEFYKGDKIKNLQDRINIFVGKPAEPKEDKRN